LPRFNRTHTPPARSDRITHAQEREREANQQHISHSKYSRQWPTAYDSHDSGIASRVVWPPARERSSRGRRRSKRGAGAHCRSWYVVKWYRHEPSDNGELRLESCTLPSRRRTASFYPTSKSQHGQTPIAAD
jgi:hypothetical protein